MDKLDPPPVFLTPSEVASILGIEPETLAKWRSAGKGPSYVKIGGKNVRYTREAIDSYILANTHTPEFR